MHNHINQTILPRAHTFQAIGSLAGVLPATHMNGADPSFTLAGGINLEQMPAVLLFHLLHLHLVIRFYWSYRLIFFICPTYDSIYVYICNYKDREAGSEENSQLMDSDPQSDRRPDQRFHGRKFLAKSPQNWTSKLNNLTNKPKWSPQNNPHLLICAPREICEFYSGVLHVCQYCSSIPLNMKRTIWQNIYHVFPIYKWPPCFQHYSTSFPPFFQ